MATWPEWNTDTAWVRLDGQFVEGATGQLKPKGGPKVSFVVERLNNHEFVDVSRMPGGRITFAHRIDETPRGTEISVTVDIGGPLGFVWRLILAGDFRTALQPDLDRLVATAEADVAVSR